MEPNSAKKPSSLGHLLALLTVAVWGATFISSKILLRSFAPIEILLIRTVIGLIALCLLYPHRLRIEDRRQELLFAAAGLAGIALYYLLEIIALSLTNASNVGIIIAIAPCFTAILSGFFLKSEKPSGQFYIGFLAAIIGICLISLRGSDSVQINPLGDFLTLIAAVTWAVYSILTKKIGELGYNTIQATRRIFFYGILFLLPTLLFMDFAPDWRLLLEPVNLGNMLFLGVGASALCFVTWNMAVKLLGAVKTSVYIYLSPVVTLTASVLILKEPLTPPLIVGSALTLAGLWISQTPLLHKKRGTAQP